MMHDILLILLIWLHRVSSVFISSPGHCGLGEYWCQDRCGSDVYGDTCCETPDGQHNLCGTGMYIRLGKTDLPSAHVL